MVEENKVTEIQIQEFEGLQENQLLRIFHDQPVPVNIKFVELLTCISGFRGNREIIEFKRRVRYSAALVHKKSN